MLPNFFSILLWFLTGFVLQVYTVPLQIFAFQLLQVVKVAICFINSNFLISCTKAMYEEELPVSFFTA